MGAIHNLLSQSRAGNPGKHAAKREEQVQLLLAAKCAFSAVCRVRGIRQRLIQTCMRLSTMRTMCKVAYQGAASTRRTIAGTGKPAPLLCGERAQEPECRVSFSPFRQGQQCIWPEYSSLRSAWAFSFRLRRYRKRWRGGHVGKKENRGSIPRLPLIICL